MHFTNQRWYNWLLILTVFSLAIAPLILVPNSEFSGADDQAAQTIQEINPNYQPWFKPLVQPASGEIASLLFSLQAGLGAGVIGYVMGLYRGRREGKMERNTIPTSDGLSKPRKTIKDKL